MPRWAARGALLLIAAATAALLVLVHVRTGSGGGFYLTPKHGHSYPLGLMVADVLLMVATIVGGLAAIFFTILGLSWLWGRAR